MLVFVRAKVYSKVVQGLGLTIHFTHLTKAVQNNNQVDLQTLERGQEIYTDTCGININQILFIGQLLCIVAHGKE